MGCSCATTQSASDFQLTHSARAEDEHGVHVPDVVEELALVIDRQGIDSKEGYVEQVHEQI